MYRYSVLGIRYRYRVLGRICVKFSVMVDTCPLCQKESFRSEIEPKHKNVDFEKLLPKYLIGTHIHDGRKGSHNACVGGVDGIVRVQCDSDIKLTIVEEKCEVA